MEERARTMLNSLNPSGNLYHRPVPAGMHVDPVGLVDAWLAAADDWLMAFDGIDQMSLREGFEGIESLGRLMRCRSELIDQCEGREILDRLKDVLLATDNREAFLQSAGYPDLQAWLEQAKAVWESETEDLPTARRLIEDLDAADFVLWYCDLTTDPEQSSLSILREYEDLLNQCHLWLDRHAMLFAIGEPYIRAAALTIPEEMETADPSGRLSLSAAKYDRLLDECEKVWRWMEPDEDQDFLQQQPTLGRMKLDYYVPQLAHAAGAQAPFVVPSQPLTWFDPERRYKAFLFLPPHSTPGEEARVEILFGTGDDFGLPAESLAGASIRLGGATGSIVLEIRDEVPTVLATVSLSQIIAGPEASVSLYVNEQEWQS
jgi:hypothetical protein